MEKRIIVKGARENNLKNVDLDLPKDSLIVFTGLSGSGKSTLLNVISGLDSYEEGEMYINGEETSHYTEKDFEEYRKTYIGNIFCYKIDCPLNYCNSLFYISSVN